MCRQRRWRGSVAAIVALLLAAAGYARQFTLDIDDVSGAGFSARGIRAVYANGGVGLQIGALTLGTQSWKNIRLDCAALSLARERIACDDGWLTVADKIPISFSYEAGMRVLNVALKPGKHESWSLILQPGARGNDLVVRIDGGRIERLAAWLPPDLPKPGAGVVNGGIRYGSDGRMAATLAVSGAAFSDASGLHAGEKIDLSLVASAAPAAGRLRWAAELTWSGGEVFWQPVYLKSARQQLTVGGTLDAKGVRIERGALHYPDIGSMAFSGNYSIDTHKLTDGNFSAQSIPFAPLYQTILRPFLADSSLSDLHTGGKVSAVVRVDERGLQSMDIRLDDVSLEDRTQHRFALSGMSGSVPWHAREQTQASLTVAGGELLKMPLGRFAIALGMNGMRFELKPLRVPLLDGYLDVRDFAARAGSASWYWQFSGDIGGISMDRLTAALGLPVMHGTLAARIPLVRHIQSSLRVDGVMNLKVFDGEIEAKNLVLLDIFGKAPRVRADVNLRNLDLELLTRTYSFGTITGRIDAHIGGLELVNWQPVKFDVKLISSPGDYPRKISQAAVQNISALGGAGAAAAIQRSFLQFFEQFGYDKLAWNCKLENGICDMSGVEDRPPGYVLVKGGGIPAITVIGYNRKVDWPELLNRIKRVTQGNSPPIVK